MDDPVPQAFDYGVLDAATRHAVQREDEQFDRNMGAAGSSFIRACHNLRRIQDALRYKHPGFVSYCGSKQGLGSSTAYRMIDVAKKFPETGNFPNAGKEALYLLAAPTTPEEARQEAIERASVGEQVTYAVAQEIVERVDTPAGRVVYGPIQQQPATPADPEADGDEDAAPARAPISRVVTSPVPDAHEGRAPAGHAHQSGPAFLRQRRREK